MKKTEKPVLISGSVQRAQTYVNGRSRKLKKMNFPTVRVAQHNSLIWLFIKHAKRTLESGFLQSHTNEKIKKTFSSIASKAGGEKLAKKMEKEKALIEKVINSLEEVVLAADHEITVARICEESGFTLVQDFEGDELYEKDARKRVEKLRKKNKYAQNNAAQASGPTKAPAKLPPRRNFQSAQYLPAQYANGQYGKPLGAQASYGTYDRYGANRGRGRPRFGPPMPGPCYLCGVAGHWRRDCSKQNKPQGEN